MSMIDDDPEYAPCQICELISYELVPCKTSGYTRICDSCVQDHALDGCASCKEHVAEQAEAQHYRKYEKYGQ